MAALTEPAPATTEADVEFPQNEGVPTPAQEQPPPIAEAKSTGTDGRILLFPVRSGTGTNASGGTGTTIPTSDDLFDLSSLKQTRIWRPIKFERNPDYPKVILDGCKFKQDSGGFALFQREPSKYLGHYRRGAIAELEKKYGKKKSRRRKN
jgi:hypothetical protein